MTGVTETYTDLQHKLYKQLKLCNSKKGREHRTAINQRNKLLNINKYIYIILMVCNMQLQMCVALCWPNN